MPYFPPNTGWSLPDQSDEPSNPWGDRYNQPAGTPNQMESIGLDTHHGLSQTEMFNYLLQFYHSHAPAPVLSPAQNPVQALGFNSADLGSLSADLGSLPQDDYSNGLTGGFNEPSLHSHIASMHGINQPLPNINPPMQDPTPAQGQEQEQGPAPRNPPRAPRRSRRNARSRARPYERPLENSQSIGVFRCEWKNCNCDCGQTFNRKGDRDRHVDTQHLERYPVACLACGAVFKRRDNLDHHWKTVHRGNDSLLAARGGLD